MKSKDFQKILAHYIQHTPFSFEEIPHGYHRLFMVIKVDGFKETLNIVNGSLTPIASIVKDNGEKVEVNKFFEEKKKEKIGFKFIDLIDWLPIVSFMLLCIVYIIKGQ